MEIGCLNSLSAFQKFLSKRKVYIYQESPVSLCMGLIGHDFLRESEIATFIQNYHITDPVP